MLPHNIDDTVNFVNFISCMFKNREQPYLIYSHEYIMLKDGLETFSTKDK